MATITTRKGFYKPDNITDNLRDSIAWFNSDADKQDDMVYYNEDETIDGTWNFASGVIIASGEYINYGNTPGSSGYGIRELSGIIEVKHSGGDWTQVNRTRLLNW